MAHESAPFLSPTMPRFRSDQLSKLLQNQSGTDPHAIRIPKKPEGFRIIGIDPGTACTGWGVIEHHNNQPSFCAAGVVRTDPADALELRLLKISQGLHTAIETWKPMEAAVEEPFFGENARSALILGHTRGAILLTLATLSLKVGSYTPREVKLAAVGKGGATKEQVAYMMNRILSFDRINSKDKFIDRVDEDNAQYSVLKDYPKDATDALAIALTHYLRT